MLAILAATSLASIPDLTLNNGLSFPQLALGVWQYDNATAADAIALAAKAGLTSIDTAESYGNQVGVGQAIKKLIAGGMTREQIVLTTKTFPCKVTGQQACYEQAVQDIQTDFTDLGVDYIDLILLHGPSHRGQGPCDPAACEADAGQWTAYEELYRQGRVKAIGVSNYCQSCFECLLNKVNVTPAVNQIAFHVGMGDDPQSLISYTQSKGILVQAYSPLGNGELIVDPQLVSIGKKYNKSSAQVALKWLVDKGVAVVTKADNAAYLAEDVDLFSWNLTAADTAALSASTGHPQDPSWACTE
eukprot:m.435810 g.435810  ORF g.435810 m.435810 type:complete len:302 (-) comp17896_c0_seq1:81-986(-)